jgi:hypothetical protein
VRLSAKEAAKQNLRQRSNAVEGQKYNDPSASHGTATLLLFDF